MSKDKILITFGTRPEIIKIAPIVDFYVKNGKRGNLIVISTGQHKDIINEFITFFKIEVDYHLDILSKGQSLNQMLVKCLSQFEGLVNVLKSEGNNIKGILAQGDTLSVLSIGIFSYLSRIPFFHLEAGLRTFDLEQPYPEEYNRRVAAVGATLHLAPTTVSKENLLREGVKESQIAIVGNTIVDALELVKPFLPNGKRNLVLITCHRRENQNEGMEALQKAIINLCKCYPHFNFVWIKHPNPAMRNLIRDEWFSPFANFTFIEPVGYIELLGYLSQSVITITDSGGIQEEAPSFKVPALVLRNKTERPESVEAGISMLVGLNQEKITMGFEKFINSTFFPNLNPYGDGKASGRIFEKLNTYLIH